MARELLQPHRLYCYYYKVLQVSTIKHFITFPQLLQLLMIPISYSVLTSVADVVYIIHRRSV